MQLKSIKLIGFKSFVDPTTVGIKGNLVAVVGPNGSGKSNIIDAVRWVMGESSAKYLRGESMADVIFNGSSSRKPAAYASIELTFDNTKGRFSGPYASYEQLSIKREVSRDGQSNYYLNGTHCRRKDIKDIFLGTGLGPRSYAIIMQDTISRLIEAKPEEFRAYIEEVAGISKYKERRHETALRIQHTRENLDRLNDVRSELGAQLNRLDKQAKAAERYKALKQEERLTRSQLYALQWREFDGQLQLCEGDILEVESQLNQDVATIRSIDLDYEEKREAQKLTNDRVADAQANYYKLQAAVTQLEQEKQHQQDRLKQVKVDYEQVTERITILNQQLNQDTEHLHQLNTDHKTISPELTQAKQQLKLVEAQLMLTEKTFREWQSHWDTFNEQAERVRQTVHVEQTRIQHLHQKKQELDVRLKQLELEQQTLSIADQHELIIELEQAIQVAQQHQDQQQERINQIQSEIQIIRQNLQHTQRDLNEARSAYQSLQGKLSSLEALQDAALRQKDNSVTQWLKQHAMSDRSRLAETLNVKNGWEKAVQTVLGHFLEAVCVDNITSVAQAIHELKQGQVLFVADRFAAQQATLNTSLAAYVETTPETRSVIQTLLASVKPVETLQQALAQLPELADGESIVTREGIWLSTHWLRVNYGYTGQTGVIERQKAIAELKEAMSKLEVTMVQHEQSVLEHQKKLQGLEAERENGQVQLRQTSARLAEIQATLKAKRADTSRQQERYQSLTQTIHTAQEQIKATQVTLATAETNLSKARDTAQMDGSEREKLLAERNNYREKIDYERSVANQHREAVHGLALRFESINTQLSHRQQAIDRNQQAITELNTRKKELEDALSYADQPICDLQAQLEIALEQWQLSEQSVAQTRQALANLDANIQLIAAQRHESEIKINGFRSQLEQKRVGLEAIKVRKLTLEEQLQQMNTDVKTIVQELPETANEAVWQAQLESVEHRISRLGAINLVAIDEFKEVSERKLYFDTQNDDLERALQTLEAAIHKIDKETRQKFKATYDTVNQYFETLFPKIFGGGNAYLELTGDDLLNTGVAVIARPPGKKNSTIHLLSGGEKALTALALVFSLFQINPAPFCMLDEVDAPLDDVNVRNFCQLVKEMSKDIQFIFISHNKLAIEMGDYLVGVTMREPGVSRLVAVDVQQAVEMAET